jgi:hypothetical protein
MFHTKMGLLTVPWVVLPSWKAGPQAAEGEHGERDEWSGAVEAEGGAGSDSVVMRWCVAAFHT